MKLSEAIRLGSMLKPQAYMALDDGGTCALGAALDASGDLKALATTASAWQFAEKVSDLLTARWPFLSDFSLQQVCPVCGYKCVVAAVAVMHLNDRHRWTREQIADWIATIEPPESQDAVPDPVPAGETVGQA